MTDRPVGPQDALHPVAETDEALHELERLADDAFLREELLRRGRAVRAIVPECVGVSVTVHEQGLTFTLVASDPDTAGHDAAQYAGGGPCVEGAHHGDVHSYTGDELLEEDTWRLFALGTAAHGIRSTLTLPLRSQGEVVGSINLYAATPHAFDGHHEAVADVFGAWATEAVTNADLGFVTRRAARTAPATARGDVSVALAVGIVAERTGVGTEEARRRLRDAAARAGLPEATFARYLVEAVEEDDDEPGSDRADLQDVQGLQGLQGLDDADGPDAGSS